MVKETLVKNGLMLSAFAIIGTALIAFTFNVTAERIAQQQKQRLLSILNEVVPHDLHDNALYADCTAVTNSSLGTKEPHTVYRARINGEPTALAIEATAPDGYSGNISLVIGVDTKMNVLGVRVLEHKETPGLGDKIDLAISNWITSFTGKHFSVSALPVWQVKKDGGEFDQFTGATITPRAVVNAVKNALLYVQDNQQTLFLAPNMCGVDNSVPPTNEALSE
ncbi:electron transport complex subunit RsxG [Alteromonas sp. 1_MG-2023]|uniref:electron transport complex subunit RsxG n=1 Tax=Alteromonas sp. 1_MG-2023 TaxID=3062669 RepID=UPI0026E39ABC|nr:electron transport complex subunit RsxG [Alteromonas sp. 1_MG-2023]MDO6567115.1 electron transport complex subunit RsxG [Alteromonas sp. 1_MG-2023]